MFVGNYNLSSREAGIGGLENMKRLFKKDFSSHILTPSGYIRKYGLAWLVHWKETSHNGFLYSNLPGESRTRIEMQKKTRQ